jgi:DNA-binding protein H-NS
MFKKLCCFLFPLLTFLTSNAQPIQVLEEKIDSLKLLKEKVDSQSKKLANEISKLTTKKLALERDAKMAIGVPIYCRLETKVYAGRGTWKDEVGTIPKGTTIMAFDFKDNYYFVAYDTLSGYVMSMNVETLDERERKVELQRKRVQNQAAQAQKRVNELQARRKSLISKYGTDAGQKISDRKIWLGMTKEMAEESWGKPRDINRTVGSWGVKEQWVYSDAYLYFDNGILNSWQD